MIKGKIIAQVTFPKPITCTEDTICHTSYYSDRIEVKVIDGNGIVVGNATAPYKERDK